MFDISAFLDRARAGAGNVSYYRLAQLIGITQAAMSQYKTGVRMPDTLVIARLCDYSGDDPDHVIACVQSMRAANDEEAAVWKRIADRLRQSGSASVAFVVGVAALFIASQADLVQAAPAYLADPGHCLRIMSTVAALRLLARIHAMRRQRLQLVA